MGKKTAKAGIEALLFMATDPVSPAEIAEVMELDTGKVEEVLLNLKDEYQAADRGMELVKINDGYQFQTKPEYQSLIKELHQPENDQRLTQAALETLAIIAYKQPATKPEVEDIRGVNVEKALKTLQRKGLVEEKGKKDTIGCPKLYGTTDKFLQHMGLESLEELPEPEEEELTEEEMPVKEAVS
jgi:segregation and condensation protein B